MDAPSSTSAEPRRFGTVAIVGRPNVGKSTLLNALVGARISITSHKVQTTRHRILGVRSVGAAQFAFADTPGFQTRHQHALNRSMNRTVTAALAEVDVVVWVLEAGRFGPEDRAVLELLPKDRPVVVVANKLDRVTPREKLFPWLAELGALRPFAEIVPMSANRPADVERLLAIMTPYLPQGDWAYEEDTLTDRSERFLAAEILREKLFRLTGDELPYTSTVVIEQFAQEGELRRIAAAIIVDRDSHKAMVIGTRGERLKRISTEARKDMEALFGGTVFLEVWVKTRSGWADDQAAVRAFGYED